MQTQDTPIRKYGKLINQVWKYCFVLAFMLMIAVTVHAGGAELPTPDENPDAPIEETPIDGGISLLVAAGVGYGAKKIHDARKRKGSEQGTENREQ